MDEFFSDPRNRLIFEALGAHDEKRSIDWHYVMTGKRK